MRSARPRRSRPALACAVAVATLAAGLLAPTTASASPSAAGSSTRQPAPVVWGPCDPAAIANVPEAERFRFSCALYAVPLDHDRPSRGSIDIALMRRAADAVGGKRIGSLFLNPGGPGGSGYRYPTVGSAIFEPEVMDRFDLIGFDPRGVARSTPLQCFETQEEADEVFARMAALPITPEEEAATLDAYADYSASCARVAGPLLQHMSTKDVARDLDLLRAAVGDRRLTFVGFSYGTLLGATYANLFPDRVRAMVLDGNVDPRLRLHDGLEYDRQRTAGFEISLNAFLARCDAAAECAFAPGSRAKLTALLDRLRAEGPVTLADGTVVDEATVIGVTAGALYDPAALEDLAAFLQEVYLAAFPAPQARRAPLDAAVVDDLLARAGQARYDVRPDAPYTSDDSYAAVNCSDKPFTHSPQRVPVIADRWEQRLRDFGRYLAWGDPAICPTWPVQDPDTYAGPWGKRTASPVLVVGNYYDPATQYRFAERMSRQLGNARLLSVDAFGHCILGGSQCADQIAARYLIDLRLPRPGTVCEPDLQPLPPATTRG
jgi:pimeloyl-ACP methyl ester carboxylesterase